MLDHGSSIEIFFQFELTLLQDSVLLALGFRQAAARANEELKQGLAAQVDFYKVLVPAMESISRASNPIIGI